jgi:DNA-binding GntR family transcriptional regulator
MVEPDPRPSSSFLKPSFTRRTAHELVRDTLRQAILSGEIERGTVLAQTTIAQQLNVSTTPVREALRDLAAEGLVLLDAHKSAVVQAASLDEMEEIYSLRLLLEPHAATLAVKRITPEHLDQATAIHNRMVETDSPEEWVSLNAQFHQVLSDAAGSPRASAMLKSLRQGALVYVGLRMAGPDQMAAGNSDHAALLEAYRNGDAQAACDITLRHLAETRRAVGEDLA